MKNLLIIVPFLLLISCGKPTINGKVIDLFGNPIEGVKVSLKGSSIETFTQKNGEYKMEFVPGDIYISYEKDGYTFASLKLNIAQESDYPAEEVQLILIPDPKGIYFVNEDGRYTEIKSMEFNRNRQYLGKGGSSYMGTSISSWDKYLCTYDVIINDSTVPVVPQEGEITFIDNSPDSHILVRLYKYSQNAFRIADIQYTSSNRNSKVNNYCILNQTAYTQQINESYTPDFLLRTSTLENGYYAFYTQQTQEKLIKKGSLLVFRVGSVPENLTKMEVLKSETDLQKGKDIYDKHCSICHLSDGGGLVGPNFTDDYWIHGNDIETMFKIVSDGVLEKGMTPFKDQLPPNSRIQVISYILSLHGSQPKTPKAPEGEKMSWKY